jgi:hypothetical protein
MMGEGGKDNIMPVQKKESKEVTFTVIDKGGLLKSFFQIRRNESIAVDSFEVFVKNHENGKSTSVILKNSDLTFIIKGLAQFLGLI